MEWLIAIGAWTIILVGVGIVLIGVIFGLVITALAPPIGIPVVVGAAIVGAIVIVVGVLILPGRNYPDDDAIPLTEPPLPTTIRNGGIWMG